MQFGRYLPAIRRNLLPPFVGYKNLTLVLYVTPCSLGDRYETVAGTCCVAPQCRRLRLFHTGTWRRVVWYRGTTVLKETAGNHCLLRPQGRRACQWDCLYSEDVNRNLSETRYQTTRCHTHNEGIFNIHYHKNLVPHLRQFAGDFFHPYIASRYVSSDHKWQYEWRPFQLQKLIQSGRDGLQDEAQ